MKLKALLTLTIYFLSLSLALTGAEHYTCSPHNRTAELTCSHSVYPPNTCKFLPRTLLVRHCSFEKIHHLQSLFHKISVLRFVFTKGWKSREDTFVRWSSLRAIDISNNGIEDVPTTTFANNMKLVYLNLNNNLLQAIAPEVFDNLPHLKYLFLSHNQLQTINLECLAWSYNLWSVDLSFNLFQVADIGPGPFQHLEEINFSHNKLTRFAVSRDIQLNFDQLRRLNLSHNQISGRLTRSECSGLEKTLVVDLSHNNIDRIDLTTGPMDRLHSHNLNSSSTFTTTYIVHNNNLACDCYAGLVVAAEGRLNFSDFSCPDGGRLSEKTQSELQCSVAEYEGGRGRSCPGSCHCHYSIILAQLTVNCSGANLADFPHVETLPVVRDNDSMVLLLANNEIQELTEDLSHLNIVHLDLANNKISDIDQTKLPASLKKLVLSTQKLESLSSRMLQYLTQSRINISLSASPLSCRCARLPLYQSLQNLLEDEEGTFCVFAGIGVSPETAQLVCSGNNYRYLITSITILLVFLLLLVYCLLPRPGRQKEFDYDVFISYSHHDAQFTENVLYPELVNNKIKCCIHTLHWEVRTAADNLIF